MVSPGILAFTLGAVFRGWLVRVVPETGEPPDLTHQDGIEVARP